MKFNFITTTISLTIFAFFWTLLYFPAKVPGLTVENFSELFMVLVCIAVIIKIKNLKSSPKVYWILLSGAILSYLGVYLDFVEEFFDEQVLNFSDLEDFIQTFGFITLFIGIQCWLSLHNSIMKNLKLISELDHLTGILNRRAFYQKVAEYKKILKVHCFY